MVLSAYAQRAFFGLNEIQVTPIRRLVFKKKKLEKINDIAYKVDLLGEYGVNVIFKVFFILIYLM